MKTSSKFFVIGAFVSVLGILTISSTGFISEVFANNETVAKQPKIIFAPFLDLKFVF